MATEKIKLVQGDTRPAIVCTLTDEVTGLALALTGATVRLKFRELGATTVQNTILGSVTNGASGICAFFPASDPTMLAGAGDFEGEIEVTFADGQIQTVYDLLKFKVRQEF
jgi:hypothetical protein